MSPSPAGERRTSENCPCLIPQPLLIRKGRLAHARARRTAAGLPRSARADPVARLAQGAWIACLAPSGRTALLSPPFAPKVRAAAQVSLMVTVLTSEYS